MQKLTTLIFYYYAKLNLILDIRFNLQTTTLSAQIGHTTQKEVELRSSAEILYRTKLYILLIQSNAILEYTIVLLKLDTKRLFLIAIYANNLEKKFINELDFLFSRLNLNDPNNLYIIAGDFNARHLAWGDCVNKRKGTLLKNWLDNVGIIYRSHIIPPSAATYPSSNSFLDLCLLDNRLKLNDLVSKKIQTLDYNSDHRALSFCVAISDIARLTEIDPNHQYRFIFKKTKCKKFSKQMARNYTEDIPHNKNLSIDEINHYINQIQDSILKTTDETVLLRN